jgi:hypothetical protein
VREIGQSRRVSPLESEPDNYRKHLKKLKKQPWLPWRQPKALQSVRSVTRRLPQPPSTSHQPESYMDEEEQKEEINDRELEDHSRLLPRNPDPPQPTSVINLESVLRAVATQ